jgi:dihydroorotase
MGQAQPTYDLLLKGGHVLDPANEVDGVLDVAVQGGRIAEIAPNIPPSRARTVVNVAGLYLTPGLIDIHAHVFGLPGSLSPDDTSLVTGATTVVDCGGAGWRTFDRLKTEVIDRVQTRVLAFLNIVGAGMVSSEAESDITDMDPHAAAAKVAEYPDLIVGIKKHDPGPAGWFVLKRALEAGRLSQTPVIVDDNIYTISGRNTSEKLLDLMRPGDLHTHMYNDQQMELVGRIGGKLRDTARAARARGVLFDLGHGGSSFLWPVAERAMRQGFPPDVISTDLHTSSIMNGVSMPNSMSKLMNLGMELNEAVMRSTVSPARAIRKFPELGTLSPGKTADIAVFQLDRGVFAFKDAKRNKLLGSRRLRCVLTVREGKVVFDKDGLSFPLWNEAEKTGKKP